MNTEFLIVRFVFENYEFMQSGSPSGHQRVVMVLPDPEDRYGARMPQQLLVRSARSLFRPKLISCPPFAHAPMPWSFAVDSPVETSGTGWQHSAEAPLCPARGVSIRPQADLHSLGGKARNRTVETGVTVMRLQNGSRWQ